MLGLAARQVQYETQVPFMLAPAPTQEELDNNCSTTIYRPKHDPRYRLLLGGSSTNLYDSNYESS